MMKFQKSIDTALKDFDDFDDFEGIEKASAETIDTCQEIER